VTIEHVRQYGVSHSEPMFASLKKIDEITELTDRARNSLAQFRSLIEKYHMLRPQMTFSELARALVDELGILTAYKEERTADSMSRWENVQELLSAITEYCHEKQDATLESFLEEVALVSDIDTWEGEQNAVTLMTLHASKGLEFPVVFIAGLEEGLLPFSSSTLESSDTEEERRLLYVGITRAEQKLYITHTSLRYRFGDVTYPSESRFLSELGTENIERLSTRIPRERLNAPIFEFDKTSAIAKRPAHRKAKDDSSYSGDSMPDYESESQEHFEMKRGIVVRHEFFGRGRVMEVTGKGETQKAVVQFEEYGRKNLIVKYAKLSPA
jgi:DNA helicase II / ATP-dependent DNA helicase PcrA